MNRNDKSFLILDKNKNRNKQIHVNKKKNNKKLKIRYFEKKMQLLL